MQEKNIYIRFFFVVAIAHVIAYLFSGGISYQLITKGIWEGSSPLLSSYLRTPGNEELWKFAMTWQIPVQFLRGVLMALVILPLTSTFRKWTFGKSTLFYAALFFVFTHFAASAPSPANLEGLVYMKPEFVKQGFWLMQVEMVLSGLIFSGLVAKFGFKK